MSKSVHRISGPAGAGPDLSIVAPVYNEARILPDLVGRCAEAARSCGLTFEIVLVDDASTDDTPALLDSLARQHSSLRPCRLGSNAGQFRATQAGLRAASGEMVVVLDGDLQDPPEEIPRLVAALTAAPASTAAVLAVKSHRDDPAAFMIGQFVFHRLQQALSGIDLPAGAGSYCIMRRAIAARIAEADLGSANLAALVGVAAAAAHGELATVPYEKGARYDRTTRVGWKGLIAEALGSLAVTGALPRLLVVSAIVLAASAWALQGFYTACLAFGAAGVLAAASALWIRNRTRRALAKVRAPGSPLIPPP